VISINLWAGGQLQQQSQRLMCTTLAAITNRIALYRQSINGRSIKTSFTQILSHSNKCKPSNLNAVELFKIGLFCQNKRLTNWLSDVARCVQLTCQAIFVGGLNVGFRIKKSFTGQSATL
jgi:hypothetical protein